jgi:hypothetical protein
MIKFLSIILAISILSGCGSFSTTKPAIVYQTQEVKTAVAVFPDIPTVDTFDSRVLKLTDDSAAGEVGQAYKIDWLTLMLRDKIFTEFLNEYKKAKETAEATTK